MIYIEKYPNNMDMRKLTRINEISSYNNNYYTNVDGDLLYGHSDDDDTTEWYLVKNMHFLYLGESYVSNRDLLHRYETQNT